MTDDARTLTLEEAEQRLRNGAGQLSWYDRTSRGYEIALTVVTWLGIAFGLFASALAAFPTQYLQGHWGTDGLEISRWIIAVCTLLVTLFSGTLSTRYRRLAITREKGRVATTLLLNLTRTALIHEAMSDAQRGKRLSEYERELLKIEADFGTYEGRPT